MSPEIRADFRGASGLVRFPGRGGLYVCETGSGSKAAQMAEGAIRGLQYGEYTINRCVCQYGKNVQCREWMSQNLRILFAVMLTHRPENIGTSQISFLPCQL